MAAVPHFGTGDSTTATAASGTGAALTVAKPANVAVGDLLIGSFYSQFSGTVTSAPSGWTLIKTFANRSGGLYYLTVPDSTALAGLPSTWSCTVSGSGRLCWDVFRVTGANLTTPIGVTGAEASQNASASFTIPAVSPTNTNDLLIAHAYWNNSSTTQSTYTPDALMTDGEQVKSPTSGNTSGIDIAYQTLSASGTTGTRTFGMSPTGASNSGVMFTIQAGSGSFSADTALTATATLSAAASTNTAGATGTPVTATSTAAANNATSGAVTSPVTVTVTAAATVSTGLTAASQLAVTVGLSAAAQVNQNAAASLAVTTTPTGAATRAATAAANLAVTTTLTSKVRTPVETWINTQPLYAAHRGGSADWPQSTMFAYDNAAAWNKDLALEASVWQSANGHWWVNHDDTLATTGQWNSSAQITLSSDATLAAVSTTVGGYPLMPLVPIAGVSTPDLLSKYGSNRVIIIDNKGSQDVAGLITILNSYGGPAWYISKSYYTSVAWAGGMRTAGYYTLGYFYDTDTANIAANQGKFDVLMEQYDASAPTWATILAYPQPVMAHIIATAPQKATAIGNGAEGFMASGVVEVVPPTGSQATVTATATTTAAAIRATTGQVGNAISVALTATATVTLHAGSAVAVAVTLTADATTGTPVEPVFAGVLVARKRSGAISQRRWEGHL
jgi:hypothetical protein